MTPSFKAVGDAGLLVEFARQVGDEAHAQVLALDAALAKQPVRGVIEVVPALVNLMVVFDPIQVTHEEVQAQIERLWPLPPMADKATRHHEVPVCFDPELTPDLAAVAQARGLSIQEVIEAITSAPLKVAMFGFAPGYGYLTGVPEAVQVPRKQQPKPDVPKGSVLVAGSQALITTLRMPTGWHIIGRTGFEVMSSSKETSFAFNVGDSLRFVPTGRETLPPELQAP